MEGNPAEPVRVPSSQHGGMLSPSKGSYMPALIEVGNERTRRIRSLKQMELRKQQEKEKADRAGLNLSKQDTDVEQISIATLQKRDAELAKRMIRKRKYREKYVLQILFEHEKLARLQTDFDRNDGALDLEKFLISVLINFELYQCTEAEENVDENAEEDDAVSERNFSESGTSRPQSRGIIGTTASAASRPSGAAPAAAATGGAASAAASNKMLNNSTAAAGAGGTQVTASHSIALNADGDGLGEENVNDEEEEAKREAEDTLLFNIASIVELFREIDVHSVGEITWEECSSLLIEQGKTQSSDVDGAVLQLETKAYQESSVVDLSKHEANVERIVYIPEKNYLAVFSQSRKFRIYDPRKLHLKQEVSGHRGSVITCCYIEPMDQIATSAADMTICLWDSSSFKLRSRIVCRDVQICLVYDASVDPSCIYSGSIDGTVSKWDLASLQLKDSRKAHKGEVNDLLVLPDMLLIASASSDSTIYLWDVQTFKPKKHLKGHKKSVLQLAYSAGCLLSVGLDQEALVWNPYVETSHLFKLKGHTHSLVGIQIAAGSYGEMIITGDIGGILRVWDVRNFCCSQVFGAQDAITDLTSFCIIPELKRIACGIGNIRLYDYLDSRGGVGSSADEENVTDVLEVRGSAWDGHRGRFFTLSRKSIKIWNAETGLMEKILKDLPFHSQISSSSGSSATTLELTAFAVSTNNRKLIVGNSQGTIASFSMMGKLLREFSVPNAPGEEVTAMALYDSPVDGPLVISGSGRGNIKIHLDTGSSLPNCKSEFPAHGDAVLGLAVGRETVASWSSDGTVSLCDMKSLKQEQVLTTFQDMVVCCDFFKSSLLCAEAGGNVSIFEKADRESPWKRTYQFHQGELLSVYATVVDLTCLTVYSPAPDHVHVYLGDMKGQIREWDVSFYFNSLAAAAEKANKETGEGATSLGSLSRNRSTTKPTCVNEGVIHADSVLKIAVIEYVSEKEEGHLQTDAVLMTTGLDKRVFLHECSDFGGRGFLCQNVNDDKNAPPPVANSALEDKSKMRWQMHYAACTLKYAEAETMMSAMAKRLNQRSRLEAANQRQLRIDGYASGQGKGEGNSAANYGKKTKTAMEQILAGGGGRDGGKSRSPRSPKGSKGGGGASGSNSQSASTMLVDQVAALDLDDLESNDFNRVCERIGAGESSQLMLENESTLHINHKQTTRRERRHPLSEKEEAARARLAKALDAL